MEFIDQNVSRENIYDKMLLLKALAVDLEADLGDEIDLKIQMKIYKSIHVIRLRSNNDQKKLDRWTPAIVAII